MSESINPNTPVTETATVTSLNSGESAATFDELDAIMSQPKMKPGKKAEKDETDEPKATKQKESKDLTSDDRKSEPKKEAKESKEAGKEKAEKLAEEKARKIFKAKHADKEIDLDEDAEFTVKVNGQDIPVKAKDLFQNYSGKVAWDKKFTELDKDRKAFRGEATEFNKSKSQIKEMFGEKDPTIRMFKMAQLAGVSPMEFRKNFFNDAIKDVETYYSLGETERKARDLEFENQYLKYQADASHKSLTEQQSHRELDRKVNTLTQQHGIGLDNFVSRFEMVDSLGEQEKSLLEKQGKFVQGKPTPEFIVETIVKDSLWSATEDALEGVKLDWTPEMKSKNILDLVENCYQQGFKPADIPEIVSEIWGKGRAKEVVSERQRERSEHMSGKKEVAAAQSSSGPMFFDEM